VKIINNSTKKDSIPTFHSSQNQYGFKAQEIQALFPDLVHINSTDGQYYINYIGLIPVLTEAIKQQSIEIKALREKVESLEKK
jgi:hypothetical protein